MKFKPEFKERLVAALRSGEYNQINDRLHDNNGYCCLGVACDLYDPSGWKLTVDWSEEQDVIYYKFIDHMENSSALGLPMDVAEHALEDDGDNMLTMFTPEQQKHATGLAISILGVCDETDSIRTLEDLNDSGLSFELIADFIEAHC